MEGIKDLAKTQIAKSPHSISIEPGFLLLSLGAKKPLLQSKSFASETVYKFWAIIEDDAEFFQVGCE